MQKLDKIREAAKRGDVRLQDLEPAADCPGFETLNSYFEGRCSRLERLWMEAHLSRCEHCLHTMAGFVRSEKGAMQEGQDTASARNARTVSRPTRWAIGLAAPALVTAALLVFFLMPTLQLQVNVVGIRAHQVRDAREFSVQDGDTLYSGDRVRIDFETNRDAYLYIFADSSSGDFRQLFPSPDGPSGGNLFAPGSHTLPERAWYLDSTAGTETLYMAAARRPITDEAALRETLERAAAASLDRDERMATLQAVLDEAFDEVEQVRFDHR